MARLHGGADLENQYRFVLGRYKFRVFDGASRLGKTAFAKDRVTPDEFLEVNLAGGAAIDLRAYRMWEHTLVLFDEAEPKQILINKKLFQAGPSPCQVQTSTTNSRAYNVYVGGMMFFIRSTVKQERIATLSPADHECIPRNSVYVRVTEPMWAPTGDAYAAMSAMG